MSKDPNRTEPKQVSFRVTDQEYEKLEKIAESMNLSVPAMVKRKAQGLKATTPKIDLTGAREIATELRRIGGNVNQIAKHLNQGINPSKGELEGIERELSAIWQLLSMELQK